LEYFDTQDIEDTDRKKILTTFTSSRQLSPEHLLELLAYMKYERTTNFCEVTYPMLITHLQSEVRYSEYVSVETVPPANFTEKVLRDTMTKICHIGWGKTKHIGGGGNSEAKITQVKWRRRVFIAELARAQQLERDGKALIISMDESYCHNSHHSNYSLLPTDASGDTLGDLGGSAGKGPRICMSGAISKWGAFIGYNAHDESPIFDCHWENAKQESVMKNGTFKELNKHGKARAFHSKKKARKNPLDEILVKDLRTVIADYNSGDIDLEISLVPASSSSTSTAKVPKDQLTKTINAHADKDAIIGKVKAFLLAKNEEVVVYEQEGEEVPVIVPTGRECGATGRYRFGKI